MIGMNGIDLMVYQSNRNPPKYKFYKGSCNFGCKALLCGMMKPLVEKSMRGFVDKNFK